MATVSNEVKAKGETLYRENRVMEQPFGASDWYHYSVMGDHAIYNVMLHKTDSEYDRCTCPWGAYNPAEERVCSHIYAAHMDLLLGARMGKEVMV